MSSDTSSIRLRAGAAAILSASLWAIVAGLLWIRGIDISTIGRGLVDTTLPILAANPTVIAIVFWLVVIFDVLIAIFGIDLYRILADGRSGLLFAPVALTGGAGLFILETLLLLAIGQGLAPVYAGATGAEQSAIEATARSLLRFRNHLLVVGGALIALAVINFGREMLRSSEFPGWLGYWGYAAGVVGIFGVFFPLFAPLIVVRSIGIFFQVLWVLIAGIILIRGR